MLRQAQHEGHRAKVDTFSSDINFIVGISEYFKVSVLKTDKLNIFNG
jgi:hypothetical protein